LTPRLAALLARLMELNARLGGKEPELTRKLVENHVFNYVFVTSAKAESELGYQHRPASEALARAIRWYRHHQYISSSAARRIARAA
jgi:dihydroflavonol-4-reductase